MLLSFPVSALIIFLLSDLRMAMDLQHFNTPVKEEKGKMIFICVYVCATSHLTLRCFM